MLVTVGLGVEFFWDMLMMGVVDDSMFVIGVIVGVLDISFLAHTFAAAFLASHPAAVMS